MHSLLHPLLSIFPTDTPSRSLQLHETQTTKTPPHATRVLPPPHSVPRAIAAPTSATTPVSTPVHQHRLPLNLPPHSTFITLDTCSPQCQSPHTFYILQTLQALVQDFGLGNEDLRNLEVGDQSVRRQRCDARRSNPRGDRFAAWSVGWLQRMMCALTRRCCYLLQWHPGCA